MQAKNFREKLGMSQGEFWHAFGVTQSGGSRYESQNDPRRIPKPVKMLMKAVDMKLLSFEDLARIGKKLAVTK